MANLIKDGLFIEIPNIDLSINTVHIERLVTYESDGIISMYYADDNIIHLHIEDFDYATFTEMYDDIIDKISSVSITDNTTENHFPIKQGAAFADSEITYNPTLDRYESAKDFFAPSLISDPGSLILGDSDISSGGRIISTESLSTGNKAAFSLQLFDDTSYKKSTVFDHTQNSIIIPIQNSDFSIASGLRENNFTQLVQANVQFMRIRFKPFGGVITEPFEFSYKINDADSVAYKELISIPHSDLTDLGGGIWELKLNNPTVFDAGNESHITTKNLNLLGGNGFTGPVLIGDPTISNFFPWLSAESIIIVRHNVSTEDYLHDYTESYTQSEKDKLASITGGRYLGVFSTLLALQTAYPVGVSGDSATVTDPSSYLYYWEGASWEDSGTGSSGDMLKSVYDPTSKNTSAFSMANMDEATTAKIFTDLERLKLAEIQAGAEENIQSDWSQVSPIADDYIKNKPTSVTSFTDVDSAGSGDIITDEERTKLTNISDNGTGDHWVSGLDVTEQSPKDQTIDYTSGTYLINGIMKTIASGGIYDLENAYGAANHYTGLTSYQHRFVTLYVDTDEVLKSVQGAAADKKEVPSLPSTPIDSATVALIEIKVDNGVLPKDIKNKEITDLRNAPAFNTDEFVKVDADDIESGHLADKLSSAGNVTFTVVDIAGVKTIKADAGSTSIKLAVQAYQLTAVTGISSDTTVVWDDNEIDPDGAYNTLTGILTIPQSWIDDYDYMTITMSVCAGWNGADTKMTQLSMYYNNGLDTLYMRDGHSKLKNGESVYNLLNLTTAKLSLANYTAGDYFYGLWENGAPYADMLGGYDNFIQVELIKC